MRVAFSTENYSNNAWNAAPGAARYKMVSILTFDKMDK